MKFSNSSLSKYQLCPRKWQYGYGLGYWAKQYDDEKLNFGSAWHTAMEHNWLDQAFVPCDKYAALSDSKKIVLECMLEMYREIYDKSIFEVNGAEEKHVIDFGPHKLTLITDAHVDHNGTNLLVEHKSTSTDIESDWYWEKLELDHQIGLYVWAMNEIGRKTETVIYDVVKVPPLNCGKVGRKQINESLTEFEARVKTTLKKNPDKYFQRRLHKPNVERVLKNVRSWLRKLEQDIELDDFPMNTGSCKAFGRRCEYFRACSEERTLEQCGLEHNPR